MINSERGARASGAVKNFLDDHCTVSFMSQSELRLGEVDLRSSSSAPSSSAWRPRAHQHPGHDRGVEALHCLHSLEPTLRMRSTNLCGGLAEEGNGGPAACNRESRSNIIV